MHINRLDHLVITASDIASTCDFYEKILGMTVVRFEGNRIALTFGNQKINVHEQGNEVKPNARQARPGTADLCFILDTPLEAVRDELSGHGVEAVRDELSGHGVEMELDISNRTGATGPIRSIYLRDPDGNLIELSNYL